MACSIFFVLFPASRSRGRPTDRTRGDPFGWSRATRHSTTRGAVPPRGTSSRRRWTPKRRYCDGSSPTRRVRASREDARGSRARARSSSLARAQPRRVRLDLNARSPRLLPRPRRFPSPGAALLSRVLIDPMLTGIPFVDDHGALRPGQLLEVCGVGGSGKTEILMRAAVNCVMPRERRGVRFGGCESSVLLLDLDGKFDTLRFLKILTARVKDAIARAAAEKSPAEAANSRDDALADDAYAESARRFQTLRCHSSLDFLKALHVVERAFERREARNAEADRGGDEDVGGGDDRGGGNPREGREGETSAPPPPPPPRRLLLVDNVAAFYWLDRASRREQGAPLSLHAVHHASAAKLQELSRRCRAPIIVTKATGGAGGASDAPASARERRGPVGPAAGHRDFLPRRWTSAVTQRVVLDVERVAPDGGQPRAREGFEGAWGYAARFVARWELPRGRPGMRYEVHGDDGIRCEG